MAGSGCGDHDAIPSTAGTDGDRVQDAGHGRVLQAGHGVPAVGGAKALAQVEPLGGHGWLTGPICGSAAFQPSRTAAAAGAEAGSAPVATTSRSSTLRSVPTSSLSACSRNAGSRVVMA
ncbi:hypothetical protein BN11_3140002 [Nostocoides australiense Ben110]|uniref:Uncharacterized protein n=1 Tax=Nostocoides australiense Ben110 TaxID=1193182 RepID=W6JYF3_9MICO|nr:hypothetical protein BN11_3140002 [Tetrasphaera australiensis Ben110]